MSLKLFSNLPNLKNKKVFLRLDLNVPLENSKVIDDYKIKAVINTIEELIKKEAVIIIATHLGKPLGREKAALSTEVVKQETAKLLGKKIKFIKKITSPKTKQIIKNLAAQEIVFLENLRFYKGELENDSVFAKKLAALADIYINDALAVSHREQASVAAIKEFLPSYSGPLLEKELKALAKIIKPKKPLVVVMGGAKIKTKAPLIVKLYTNASQILLGGGLANTFLKFKKIEIGHSSLYDKSSIKIVKKILTSHKNKIILPIDAVVKTKENKVRVKKIKKILKSDTIFDIGPETINLYAKHIKKAQTLIWNGPMGKFEDKDFRFGTMAIARLIASHSSGRAYGLVGGGETVTALRRSGMIEYVDWVSTAGGAMLAYLGKEKMPGL